MLVRVFGGEGIIDRNKENATVAWLAENGLGPKYYGRFANGRIEGFFVVSLSVRDTKKILVDAFLRNKEEASHTHPT